MNSSPIRIATRASRLALWQADHVAQLLAAASPDREVQRVEVTTTGDRDRVQKLSEFGGVGVFTREVQRAVLDRRADLAVHSLKDLPTESVTGLVLAAVPERAPMFDMLVWPASRDEPGALDALPHNARVGTGSPRRQAQLRHRRDDLQMLEVRGNVETRLKKLDDGEYDALVLAEAGLRRLELLGDRHTALLQPPMVYPAVGQGALGIECREDDADLRSLLERLIHPETYSAVIAERSLLARLRAGCHAPLGVWTRHAADQLTLEAVVLSLDGRQRLIGSASGSIKEPEPLGRTVADDLLQRGADVLVAAADSDS